MSRQTKSGSNSSLANEVNRVRNENAALMRLNPTQIEAIGKVNAASAQAIRAMQKRIGSPLPASRVPLPAAQSNSRASNPVARVEREAVKEFGVSRPGMLSRSGIRHGKIRRIREHRDSGHVCHTYEGTERLSELNGAFAINEGYLFDKVQLNPTAFGVVLPQFTAPYSKFLFKKVDVEFVPEISFVNIGALGSIYFGASFDPSAPVPTGTTGVNSVATWAPNDMICPVKSDKKHVLNLRLDRGSQIPLFVRPSDDQEQLSSQAQIVAIAGVDMGSASIDVIAYGEWFIHYTVEMYQLNTENDDIAGSILQSSAGVLPSASTAILTYFTDWNGDGSIMDFHNPTGTAVNMSLPSDGSYIVTTTSQCNTAGATGSVGSVLIGYSPAGAPFVPLLNTGYNAGTALFTSSDFNGNGGGAGAPPILGRVNGTATASLSSTSHALFAFSGVEGAPLLLTFPTISSGTQLLRLQIIKIDSIYHADGILPNTPVTELVKGVDYAQQRRLFLKNRKFSQEVSIPATELIKILHVMNEMSQDIDNATWNEAVVTWNLPIARRNTTVAVVDVAAMAAWALKTFGGIVAAKVLAWMIKKLSK